MTKRIYIGSLNIATTKATLLNNFATHGTIVQVVLDHNPNGLPQGTAQVEYTTDAAGDAAIAAKHGATIDGHRITVVGRG